MRIESLHYFLEVARIGSFSLAARQLYVSQQGLSKAVQSLEKELGTALFERTGKRIRLTEAGFDLVPLATACVEDYAALEKTMRKHAEASRSCETIKLTAMPFVAGLFTLMRDSLDEYDLRNVILAEKSMPEILEDIADPTQSPETAAMVVVPDAALGRIAESRAAAYVPLFRSSIVLVGTKALLSPRKRCYTIEEVAGLPIAYYNEPVLESILKSMFVRHPFENVIMHASNLSMINEYIESGRAVTFSDAFSAYLSAGAEDALYLPIRHAATFTVGFLYSSVEQVDAATLAYIDRFKACIEETCSLYLAKHPLVDARPRPEGEHPASGATQS